ncbi:hypothetical protein EON63_00100 [archaeon]|nr:MAG: hypothetical protein EON63_00100 [archaeon]
MFIEPSQIANKSEQTRQPSHASVVAKSCRHHQPVISTRRLGWQTQHFYTHIYCDHNKDDIIRRLQLLKLGQQEERRSIRQSLDLHAMEDFTLSMEALERDLAAQLFYFKTDPEAAAVFCRSWGINANRKLLIRRRNVFRKTCTGTRQRTPISPYALIQDALRAVDKDEEESREELATRCSEAERGFELMQLFVRDLLGRQTAAARIFMLQSELEFEIFHGTSWQLKAFVVLLIVCMDGFFIYYAILKGFSKGLSWQADYVKAWGLQVAMDVVLFETVKCTWFHFIMPRTVAKEVQAAYHTVQDTVWKLFNAHACAPSSSATSAVCFNAADYFFVSCRLAHSTYSGLLESCIVKTYSTHLPGPAGQHWQKQVDMLYETPKSFWQKTREQLDCSVSSLVSLPLWPFRVLMSTVLSTIVRAPLAVQSVIIRMIEPLLLYACTFSFLMVKDDPVILAVCVGAAALLLGGLVWDSVRATSSTDQLAPEHAQHNLILLPDAKEEEEGGEGDGHGNGNGNGYGDDSDSFRAYSMDGSSVSSSMSSSVKRDIGIRIHSRQSSWTSGKSEGGYGYGYGYGYGHGDGQSTMSVNEGKVTEINGSTRVSVSSISIHPLRIPVQNSSTSSDDDGDNSSDSYGSSESGYFDSDVDTPLHTSLDK